MNTNDLFQAAIHNQFLVGASGAGLIGYALVQARQVPSRIAGFLVHQTTVHLTVRGEDSSASYVDKWLAGQSWMKKSRNLAVGAYWEDSGVNKLDTRPYSSNNIYPEKVIVPRLIPGPGINWIWYKGRPIRVHVSEEKGGASDGQAQRLITTTLTTFGRSRKIFETLLAEVMASQKSSDDVDVYVWNAGRYKSVEDKPSRPMDSVFLDPDLKKDILSDAIRFSTGASWYRERSLPHRRGYLLDGPPGTGKSSTIHALASELKCPLYIINPNNLSDDSIAEAFQLAGRGIIVLEDVDRIKVAISEEGVESPPLNSGLSLSGFLNAIDGVAASEGRILIMTSNRPDILDPAFIRPGRIDRQFHIGYLSPSTALAMTCRFLGDVAGHSFYSTRVECLLAQGLAASRLQNMLLEEIAKTEGWT